MLYVDTEVGYSQSQESKGTLRSCSSIAPYQNDLPFDIIQNSIIAWQCFTLALCKSSQILSQSYRFNSNNVSFSQLVKLLQPMHCPTALTSCTSEGFLLPVFTSYGVVLSVSKDDSYQTFYREEFNTRVFLISVINKRQIALVYRRVKYEQFLATLGYTCAFKHQRKLLITGKEMKTHSILIYSNCMVFLKFEKVITQGDFKHFTDSSYFLRKIIINIGTNQI